jgi:hypothetical protein
MSLPYTWSFSSGIRGVSSLMGQEDRILALTSDLERMYEKIAESVNGQTRADTDIGSLQYLPVIMGTTVNGTGTYTSQTGWAFRQGLLVDAWFDITWTAHTGAGNLSISLPYECSASANRPFVGKLQLSDVTFAGSYCVLTVEPATFTATMWTCATAASTSQIPMDTTGRAIGHARYIARSIERRT